jgi:hypothetical protein
MKTRARKPKAIPKLEIHNQPPLAERPKALVFISHDSRDAELAEAFATLLSDVSAGMLKSFRSSDTHGTTGIAFGAEWYTSIMSQLGNATDVVALLTARSLDRPWILYEAGVAKGKLDATVLGLAIDVSLEKVSTGPFGQFQNCAADEDSLTKLVMQLLRRNPDAAPREEAVRRQVSLFIAAIQRLSPVDSRRAKDKPAADDENVAKLFEEVKAMVRELPDKLDRRTRPVVGSTTSWRSRRLKAAVLDELLRRAFDSSRPRESAAALLLLLSTVRDAAPWSYEPGMEIYRGLVAEDSRAIKRARETIMTVAEIVAKGLWSETQMPFTEQRTYSIIRDLPQILISLAEKYLGSGRLRKSSSSASDQSALKL